MSRQNRRDLIDESSVGVYHCLNRCVRQAFLCGEEPVSGRNYDHRKSWIQRRLEFLAGIFAVDVLGFSVPSNHFRLVLACTIYVDLNPIRATIATTPETSAFTSAYERIQARRRRAQRRKPGKFQDFGDLWLAPVELERRERQLTSQTKRRASDRGFLPLTEEQYLELLDWTGRQIRSVDRPAWKNPGSGEEPAGCTASPTPARRLLRQKPTTDLAAVLAFYRRRDRSARTMTSAHILSPRRD